MSEINPFASDWQDCLRAHYTHVVCEHDDNNEKSLITVLIDSGFTEDTIRALREEIVGPVSAEEYQDEQELLADDAFDAPIGEPESMLADDVLIEPIDGTGIESQAETPTPLEPADERAVKPKKQDKPPEEPTRFEQMSLL